MKSQRIQCLVVLIVLAAVEALISVQNQPLLRQLSQCHSIEGRRAYCASFPTSGSRSITQLWLSTDEEEIFFRYDLQQRHYLSNDSVRNNKRNTNATTASQSSSSSSSSFLDDLTPPPFNFARDSILFSENPATRRNNAMTQLWGVCQTYLPPVMTGIWPWKDPSVMERNPFGALYNMVLVRIPTIGIGLVYIHNLWDGHGWIVDFGRGAFEMSPIVVFSVLAFILA
jgi:hypothetical protein